MASGIKKNPLTINHGASWMDKWAITSGTTYLEVLELGAGNVTRLLCWYRDPSTAITLTNYANFPKGTVIYDEQAYKVHIKVAAEGTSTWKSSAAMT